MTLEWETLPSGDELATGDGWVYLIARDDRTVILTRWAHAQDRFPDVSVARQAALYAIQLATYPGLSAGTAGHLRDAAQAYESGLGVPGYPAWRH